MNNKAKIKELSRKVEYQEDQIKKLSMILKELVPVRGVIPECPLPNTVFSH